MIESAYDDQIDDHDVDLNKLLDKQQNDHNELLEDQDALQSKVNVVLTLSIIALVIGILGVGFAVLPLLKKKSA